MSQDRRTKAELLDELAGVQADLHEAIAEADDAAKRFAALDPEARAIAEVVDALERLTRCRDESNEPQFFDKHGRTYVTDPVQIRVQPLAGRPDVARVLSYAAARFGLPDPRAQVEQLNDELGRVNAELHRTRAELAEVRHAAQQIVRPEPQF